MTHSPTITGMDSRLLRKEPPGAKQMYVGTLQRKLTL